MPKSWKGSSTLWLRPTTTSMASRCLARPHRQMEVPEVTVQTTTTTQTQLHCWRRETIATFKNSALWVALSLASTSATIWSCSSSSSTNVWRRLNSRIKACLAAITEALLAHFITREFKVVLNARGKTSQTSPPFNNSRCRCSKSSTGGKKQSRLQIESSGSPRTYLSKDELSYLSHKMQIGSNNLHIN